MSVLSRILRTATMGLGIAAFAVAAETPKDNPPGPTAPSAPAGDVNSLEFAGVTTVGNKTTITLYDKQQKSNTWVDVGKTVAGITVVKYDSDHDQVTVRRNGVEKTLPLRPPSAVAAGNNTPIPAAPVSAAPAAPAPTSTTSLSQARQEEEARMLVSDLLEIGMAQRKAYEEAQKRAAAGQAGQPASAQPTAPQATAPQSTPPAPAPAAQSTTPSGG